MVNFRQLLDKATNPELSDPDWEAILEIVEEIKSKSITMKNVMKEFRRCLLDKNSKIVYYTLLVLDSVMKNCSTDVHSDILSKEFMQVMKGIISASKDGGREVDKALELIGEWKTAFGQQSEFKAVQEVFSELEKEGYHIPETPVASAAFIKKPPDFNLSDHCYTCRQEFNRFKGHFRHHCRNCGKSVCTQCSGNRTPLPEFGITEPTRVCDICYKKMDSGLVSSDTPSAVSATSDLPAEYLRSSLAKESQQPATSSPAADTQFQEEDDIQLAIAMSLNEHENKGKRTTQHSSSPSLSAQITTTPSAPPPTASSLYATIVHDPMPERQPASSSTPFYNGEPPEPVEEADPNLARYLNRNYWEQRKEQQVDPPTVTLAPPFSSRPPNATSTTNAVGPSPVVVSNGPSGSPLAESVRKTVEMFVQRLHEMSSAGGSVATDPVVLTHYQNLSALQPQLLKQIDDIQQKKAFQQGIIHKLNEAKEARVTLNRMRREHQEKVRQQEQEQTILARMQMEQKLALLRQQKAEQVTFQEVLQRQRLDDLHTQRSEFEKQLQQQREAERQQLIAKEKQVLQQQFGGLQEPTPQATPNATPMGMPYAASRDQGTVSMAPLSTMTFQSYLMNPAEQAPPLPTKVEYNPVAEPLPPPYHPSQPGAGPFQSSPRSYSPGRGGQSNVPPSLPVGSQQQPYSVQPSQFLGTNYSLPPQQTLGTTLESQPSTLSYYPAGASQPQQHGASQPQQHGASQPQQIGASQPQQHGASQLQQHGASQPQQHGASQPQQIGASQPQQIGASQLQQIGASQPQQHGATQLQQIGASQLQQHGATQPQQFSSLQASIQPADSQQTAYSAAPAGWPSQEFASVPQFQPQQQQQQHSYQPPQSFTSPPLHSFAPTGPQQLMGVANGYAPPTLMRNNSEPPLITFD